VEAGEDLPDAGEHLAVAPDGVDRRRQLRLEVLDDPGEMAPGLVLGHAGGGQDLQGDAGIGLAAHDHAVLAGWPPQRLLHGHVEHVAGQP
jgi:hypothetical protein